MYPTKIVAEFDDLTAIERAPLRDGRMIVEVNGSKLDCLFYHRPERRLFVILHGFRDAKKHPLPVFQRWSWHDMFPGSVLYVSDPTLMLEPEEMQLGWYVGTEANYHIADISHLVCSVVRQLGIGTDDVITYGSSGGGFAALMLAAQLGDATAVAINAQTRVLEYIPRFVEKLLQKSFGGKSREELSPAELARLDAIDAFINAPNAKCLYVQNIQDINHYERHYLDFCKATGARVQGGVGDDKRVVTLLYDDPAGHGAEPKHLAPRLISMATELAQGRASPNVESGNLGHVSVRAEQHGVDRGLGVIIGQVRGALPQVMTDVTDNDALRLMKEVLHLIRREIESTVDGVVNVAGLGHFRVKQIQRRTQEGVVLVKQVVFRTGGAAHAGAVNND